MRLPLVTSLRLVPSFSYLTMADTATGEAAPKTFTQAEVDSLIKTQTEQASAKQRAALAELDALKTKSTLTAKEREELETRLEQMKAESMTKEELAREKEQKLTKAAETERTQLKGEAETWRNRYTDETIKRSLSDAASKHDAFNPVQIVTQLKSLTKLVELLDENGKSTGSYAPKVTLTVGDKALELSPEEAVAKLKEDDSFANLFKSSATGGIGGGNTRKSGGAADPAKLAQDPAKYREGRKNGTIKFT